VGGRERVRYMRDERRERKRRTKVGNEEGGTTY
jgi:hypothetical protein